MSKPKISVIMSCYNESANILKLSIESILTQTFENFELLIALDNPNNTIAIETIENYAKLDKRIKFFVNKQNYGRSKSRNMLIAKSQAEYVAIMDADDISLSSRLEEEMRIIEKKNIDVVGSWVAEFIDEFGREIHSYRKVPEHHKDIVKHAKFRSPMNHPTVLFKKSLFMSVGGYDESLYHGEDYYLFVKMLMHNAYFYNIQDVLLLYRISKDFHKRRGFNIFCQDYLLMKKIYQAGFISKFEFLMNVAIRFTYRLLPSSLFKQAFSLQRKF